jgi:urease accessory protein
VDRLPSAPFGAVRANYPNGSGIPEVQITNPSGGILGGDRLEAEVDLAPVASATVLTQAANKAYRGEASQATVLRVGGGGFLEYLPHHIIPYAGSNYRQETALHLVSDAALHAWDAYAAGRVARGARFAFGRLRNLTRVFRDDGPEATDGFDLAAASEHFGGYSYAAGVHVLAPEDLGPLAEELHHSLADVPRAFASASVPAPGLCVARVLADRAPELYRALNGVRSIVRERLGLPTPARRVI